ncbi:MAG: hypothetical protein ACJ768_06835 [Gaiellaceae bacterium]
MDDSPEVKKAQTESAFREVNERIAENAERFDAESTEFICECADPDCIHRVEASLEEYEEVREDGATFLLAPGHGDGSIERVVEHRGHFMIVEKVHAAARAIVRRLDPRAAEA